MQIHIFLSLLEFGFIFKEQNSNVFFSLAVQTYVSLGLLRNTGSGPAVPPDVQLSRSASARVQLFP